MKCWAHSETDAVAVCVSCGKGLCKECSIALAGRTYCKTCVENERWRVPPTPPPEAQPTPPTAPLTLPPTPPKAEPTRIRTSRPGKGQFMVGGIGSILNVLASIPLFILAVMLFVAIFGGNIPTSYYSQEFWYFWPFGPIIMAGIGYLGLRRNYGSAMGVASFAFAIITVVLLIVLSLASMAAYYEYGWRVAQVIQGMWFNPFGVMQIVWGATHIVNRKFTGRPRLSLATGIMLILAGIFTATGIIAFVGIALFFAAEIMASVLFFKSEVHPVSKP